MPCLEFSEKMTELLLVLLKTPYHCNGIRDVFLSVQNSNSVSKSDDGICSLKHIKKVYL